MWQRLREPELVISGAHVRGAPDSSHEGKIQNQQFFSPSMQTCLTLKYFAKDLSTELAFIKVF